MKEEIQIENPYYKTIYSKGTYKGHKFTITDLNGELFVIFDNYVDVDSPTYLSIVSKIVDKYAGEDKEN